MTDFFRNIFAPIVDVLEYVLLYFHDSLGAEWWLSIAILTVVVRSLLFPLTIRQVRSMRAMQDLKPEMDKIRAKYKDNKQKQQEEIMKLYQERQINPLGSCLPILVQMPIFIGIFLLIQEFGGSAGFIGGGEVAATQPTFSEGGILWFENLSQADQFFILPILSAITMLLSMEITNKNMDPQQRWLMRILPFGITFITWTFPAGLFVYWITSNLVTLVQNYLIYNFGPGKKTPPSEKEQTPRSTPTAASESSPELQNGAAQPQQKAKGARKRRRKKKR